MRLCWKCKELKCFLLDPFPFYDLGGMLGSMASNDSHEMDRIILNRIWSNETFTKHPVFECDFQGKVVIFPLLCIGRCFQLLFFSQRTKAFARSAFDCQALASIKWWVGDGMVSRWGIRMYKDTCMFCSWIYASPCYCMLMVHIYIYIYMLDMYSFAWAGCRTTRFSYPSCQEHPRHSQERLAPFLYSLVR